MVKNSPANAGELRDAGSIPGLGRSPRGGNGNPLQCSCLENPMDGGAWRATKKKKKLTHFPIQQKLTQHCNSTILQLKNNNN